MDRSPPSVQVAESDAELGRRVREGFERGRQIAIARTRKRADELRRQVLQVAEDYLARGRHRRDLARLILERMPGLCSRRQVQRILATHYSLSTSAK